MRRPAVVVVAVAMGVAAGSMPASAQGAVDEIRAMEAAARLEAQGDFGAAERVLAAVVAERPVAAPALLALERVLRAQGRLEELPTRIAAGLALEPASALLNQLLIRTYSALDRVAELEAAGSAWIEAAPGIEAPYRELARVWIARGDYDRARTVLEAGRGAVAGGDALALELGDLYAQLGEPGLAAREWDRAIGAEGRGLNQVRRGLRSLPDGGAAVLPALVQRLGHEPVTPARRAAAVELAVAAGLEDAALDGASRVLAGLDGPAAEAYLIELARRAEGARARRVAHWAYGQLVARGGESAPLPVRSRYRELAMELGEVAAGPDRPHDTGRHRAAEALRIELLAAQDPGSAYDALRELRERYPDAPESDRLTAVVATALIEEGEGEAADRLLRGARGTQGSLIRGHRALAAGDVETARAAYTTASRGLPAVEATRVLSLVSLLARVSGDAAAWLGAAMDLAARGDPGQAVDGLVAGSAEPGLGSGDRSALLEFAATLADDHQLDADRDRIRRAIVADHPRSREAPAALLGLARTLAPRDGGTDEARELLERLIIEHPRSALVPQARRELARLRGR